MADFVTAAKFVEILSELRKFPKSGYMTAAHFFHASIKIFGFRMADCIHQQPNLERPKQNHGIENLTARFFAYKSKFWIMNV